MTTIHVTRAATRATAPASPPLLPVVMAWLHRVTLPTRQPADQSLLLERGARHWVRRPLGRTVTCESGTLWLTFDHTPLDTVLEAGESHLCTANTALLVYALEPAGVRLT